MKVVLAVDALAPTLTGIGRYTWELARRLPLADAVDEVRYFRHGQWVTDPATLLQPPAPTPGPRRRKRPGPVARWWHAQQTRCRCHRRVFHGPNFFLPDCADIGVITVHDLSIFRFPETHPAERLRHFEQEFQSSLARASRLITVSTTMQHEISAFLGWPRDRISVTPLGHSPHLHPRSEEQLRAPLAQLGLTPGCYTLCVSTLEPRKRIDTLIRCYRRLPPALRDRYPLVLAGPTGWLADELLREIDAGTREGWLRHLGFVPEEMLPELFAGARLFALLSMYEGFGLPVLEAMASGVPVLASRQGSFTEICGDAAMLVTADDNDAVVEGLARALTDDNWRRASSEAGLARAREYSWSRCVDTTIDAYRLASQGA